MTPQDITENEEATEQDKSARSNKQEPMEQTNNVSSEEEEEGSNIRFYPPVYLQRYIRVREQLKELLDKESDSSPKMIMEVGAAELSMHVHLKNIDETVQKLVYLDIDENLLERTKDKVRPLAYESLIRRETPLEVQVYSGSATETDDRILKSDPPLYAIVGIEILEHLDESIELEFISTIFGKYGPPIIILTTPNGDFNEYLAIPPKTFRHWDHRFELSRQEFINWCQRVCEYYPKYTFKIEGIGKGPEDSESYGCCSQMAVFYLKNKDEEKDGYEETTTTSKVPDKPFSLHPIYRVDQNRNGSQIILVKDESTSEKKETVNEKSDNPEPYKLIESVSYSWEKKPPISDQVKSEVRYHVNQYLLSGLNLECLWENNQTTTSYKLKEALELIHYTIKPKKTEDTVTLEQLKNWLEEDGYKLTGELGNEEIIIPVPTYESYYPVESSPEVEQVRNYDDLDNNQFNNNVSEGQMNLISDEDWE